LSMKGLEMFDSLEEVKMTLEEEVKYRENVEELSYNSPDPLMIARKYRDEYISLICALFAYGRASSIVKFLDSLDFTLIDDDEVTIERRLKGNYYRFQNSKDIMAMFKTIRRIKQKDSIEDIIMKGYSREGNILDGLWELIKELEMINNYDSRGYRFLIGRVPKKISSASPFKRYMLYFRWMVRESKLDLGLWNKIDRANLIIPLDTHTFNISKRLGLLKRKSYDLKSAIELTNTLKMFDSNDPLKYDFAIYRLGQEKLLDHLTVEDT